MDPFELRYQCLTLAFDRLNGGPPHENTEENLFKLAHYYAEFVAGKFEKIPALAHRFNGGAPLPTNDPTVEQDIAFFNNGGAKSGNRIPDDVKVTAAQPKEVEWSEERYWGEPKAIRELPPDEFIGRMSTLDPLGKTVPFDLYEYQKVLTAQFRDNLVLIVTARQMGITALTTAYALWFAMLNPQKHVVHAVPRRDAATELVERTRFFFDSLPHTVRTPLTVNNRTHLEFANGSSINFVPMHDGILVPHISPKTFEPVYRWDLMVLHDFAFFNNDHSNALYNKFNEECVKLIKERNMHVIAYSCPCKSHPTDGFFYKAAQVEDTNWKKIKLPYTHHPSRDEEWARKMREDLGEVDFRREYMCEFNPSPDVFKEITDPEIRRLLVCSGQLPNERTARSS